MGRYNLKDLKEALNNDFDGFLQKRADVRTVLKMPHVEFQEWYRQRREASQSLLGNYKLAADIPSFELGPDGYIMLMRSNRTPELDGVINSLEAGLDYLNLIKELREKGLKTVEQE